MNKKVMSTEVFGFGVTDALGFRGAQTEVSGLGVLALAGWRQ